jgi:hypothetical protein
MNEFDSDRCKMALVSVCPTAIATHAAEPSRLVIFDGNPWRFHIIPYPNLYPCYPTRHF